MDGNVPQFKMKLKPEPFGLYGEAINSRTDDVYYLLCHIIYYRKRCALNSTFHWFPIRAGKLFLARRNRRPIPIDDDIKSHVNEREII